MKKTFYILNLTWGLPINIIGGVVSLVLLLAGRKVKRHGGCWFFEIGEGWGGLELGLVFLVNKKSSLHLRHHELGHAFQNAVWGVFYPLTIGLWSVVRYWYRKARESKGLKNPPYDSIWFEKQATNLGKKYYKLFWGNNEN